MSLSRRNVRFYVCTRIIDSNLSTVKRFVFAQGLRSATIIECKVNITHMLNQARDSAVAAVQVILRFSRHFKKWNIRD